MVIESSEARLLAEIAFLAAAKADVRRTNAILDAVALVRPKAGVIYFGKALALLNSGDPDKASAVLEEGLQQVADEDKAELNAFRGLALLLAGRTSESQRAAQAAGDIALAKAVAGIHLRPNR